jgi:hypothetical protein
MITVQAPAEIKNNPVQMIIDIPLNLPSQSFLQTFNWLWYIVVGLSAGFLIFLTMKYKIFYAKKSKS